MSRNCNLDLRFFYNPTNGKIGCTLEPCIDILSIVKVMQLYSVFWSDFKTFSHLITVLMDFKWNGRSSPVWSCSECELSASRRFMFLFSSKHVPTDCNWAANATASQRLPGGWALSAEQKYQDAYLIAAHATFKRRDGERRGSLTAERRGGSWGLYWLCCRWKLFFPLSACFACLCTLTMPALFFCLFFAAVVVICTVWSIV